MAKKKLMWNNEEELLKSYREYLVENAPITEDSINSYISYIRNLFSKVIVMIKSDSDILGVANRCVLSNNISEEFTKIRKIISQEKINQETGLSLKTISNYSSSLNMFQIFIESICESNTAVENTGDILEENKIVENDLVSDDGIIEKKVYNHQEVVTKLRGRAKAEDRKRFSKSDVCYPIRAIMQICSRTNEKYSKQVCNWIDCIVDNTKIILSHDGNEQCKMSEVSKIIIENNGDTYVELHNQKKMVYTRTSDNKFRPLKCEKGSLRNFSRDHITPLSEIMVNLSKQNHLNTIKDLTRLIYDCGMEPDDFNNKENTTEFWKKNESKICTDEYVKGLLRELEEILPANSEANCEIMSRVENTIKGGINKK